MSNKRWWIRQIILILVDGFFLCFGIDILIAAYQLNDPFYFVMIFFSSNFIILLSLTMLVALIYQMIGFYRNSNSGREERDDSLT